MSYSYRSSRNTEQYRSKKKKKRNLRRTRSVASLDQSFLSSERDLDRSFRSSIRNSRSSSNLQTPGSNSSDSDGVESVLKVASINVGGDPRQSENRKKRAKALLFDAKGAVNPDILVVLNGWSDPRAHIGGFSDFEFAPRINKGSESPVSIMWRKKLFKYRSVRDVWDWERLKTLSEKFPLLRAEHISGKVTFVGLEAQDNLRILVGGWTGPDKKSSPQSALQQTKDYISFVSAFVEEEEKAKHVIIGGEFGCDLRAAWKAADSELKFSSFCCPLTSVPEEVVFAKTSQTGYILHYGPRFYCNHMTATSAKPLVHPLIHGSIGVSQKSKRSIASVDLVKLFGRTEKSDSADFRTVLKTIEKKLKALQLKEIETERKKRDPADTRGSPSKRKRRKDPPAKNYFSLNSSEEALLKMEAEWNQLESDHKQEKLMLLQAFKDKL